MASTTVSHCPARRLTRSNLLAILSSFNRNFKSRNDGNSRTMNFLSSPAVTIAKAFSDKLSFNPLTDSLTLPSGELFRFKPPSSRSLPPNGFATGNASLYPSDSPDAQPEVEVLIKKDSQRLQELKPFPSLFTNGERELPPLTVLMRVRGKCTTDHISAAVRSPVLRLP